MPRHFALSHLQPGTLKKCPPIKRKRDRSNLWLFLALLMFAGWLTGLEIHRAVGG